MSVQYIYDLIPLAIDRAVEEVLAEYEWEDVENPYRGFNFYGLGFWKDKFSDAEIITISNTGKRPAFDIWGNRFHGAGHPVNLRLHNGLLGSIFG